MYTKYNLSSYNVEDLRKMDERALRREYSRLRDVAHKRLQRLGQSEFNKGQTYLRGRNAFPTLDKIRKGSKSQISKKLSDLKRFIDTPTSTVSGARAYRKKVVKSLHDKGYDFITEKNLDQFNDFMDYNRSLKVNGIYDSARVTEVFKAATENDIPINQVRKDFDWWVQNYDKVDQVPITSGKASAIKWKKAIQQMTDLFS